MEKINQRLRENKSEKLEKEECFEFVETIKNSIFNTFPFVSEDQKISFADKLDTITKNKLNFDEAELIRNIRIVISSLDNTHTNLKKNNQEIYLLQSPIFYKAHKFWIKNDGRILEVISINGSPISELVQTSVQEVGGGTDDYKIHKALRDLNASEITSTSIINVKDEENNQLELNVNFIDQAQYLKTEAKKKNVSSKILNESTGYLKINSWSSYVSDHGKNVADLVEEELKILKKYPSLVIDVRGNGGGNSTFAEQLAGHFIKQPVYYTSIKTRVDSSDTLSESKLFLKPQSEFLNQKVIILTDSECLSSNELFIMMLKDTGIAITIGQTTGGGSGNPKSLNISLRENSYSLNVSTWKAFRNNGEELENKGIAPDIQTEIKPRDVINNYDVDLEIALEYLNKQ